MKQPCVWVVEFTYRGKWEVCAARVTRAEARKRASFERRTGPAGVNYRVRKYVRAEG